MLQRTIFTFLGRLGLVLASLSGLPALAQPELIYKVPAWQFSIEKASHGELKALPGGSVRIHAITRDPLFVSATFRSVKGRIEVTQVVVHFHSDRAGGYLASLQIKDPQSGNVLDTTTFASGKLISDPSGISTYTRQIPPTKPPKTIGAEAIIRLQIGTGWPIEPTSSSVGQPLDLIEVEVFYKNPALKLPIPGTSVNPNSPGPVRATVPPAAPSVPSVPPPAPSIPNVPHSKGVIYVINDAHELMWYRHDGRADGSFQWAANEGSRIGIGWNFFTVLGAGDGVMYGINGKGDLIWYRYAGAGNGSWNWPEPQGQTVNSGFRGMEVVAAGHGVLYALNRTGDLLWYRHDGYADGTDRWTAREGRVIASNWPRVRLFAGDAGTLYALTPNGDLYRFRYDGRADGSGSLPFAQGQKIASNWNYFHPFSAGDGIIYALGPEHQLLWFRDDGTVNWESAPKQVGVGWQFHTIFSGASLKP